jgi:ubiquitin C-terminal hydrolase
MIDPSSLEVLKQDKKLYDLYAISNHFGSLNGGHYTAYCMNPANKNWYEFDDGQVSRIGTNIQDIKQTVVTKGAYVLFYKVRK